MADYQETTIAGKAWKRAWQIVIANTLGGAPMVRYEEEAVINFDDGKQIRQMAGGFGYTVDPLAEISLVDVETLLPTGETVPVALVHQALFSDYITRAKARDEEQAAPEQPTN